MGAEEGAAKHIPRRPADHGNQCQGAGSQERPRWPRQCSAALGTAEWPTPPVTPRASPQGPVGPVAPWEKASLSGVTRPLDRAPQQVTMQPPEEGPSCRPAAAPTSASRGHPPPAQTPAYRPQTRPQGLRHPALLPPPTSCPGPTAVNYSRDPLATNPWVSLQKIDQFI